MQAHLNSSSSISRASCAIAVFILHGAVWSGLHLQKVPVFDAVDGMLDRGTLLTLVSLDNKQPELTQDVAAMIGEKNHLSSVEDLLPPWPLVDLPTPLITAVSANVNTAPSEQSSAASIRQWRDQVRERINQAWLRPEGMGIGSLCQLLLIQNANGGVMGVQVLQCTAESAVRDALVSSMYRTTLPPFPNNVDKDQAIIEFQMEPVQD